MTKTTSATATFRVQLFGGPRLFAGSEERPLSPSHAALLALVFGNGVGSLDRSQASSILWPGVDPKTAGRRLSQLLYSLRTRAGSRELIQKEGGGIRPAVPTATCDLEDFWNSLEGRRLKVASALLAKGFCLRISDSQGRTLIDWIEGREGELRRELRRKAEKDWLKCVQEEDWEGACEPIDALFVLSPEKENLLQRLMETKAKAGRRLEAQEAFDDFSAKHVGGIWKPQEDTEALLANVRSSRAWVGEPGRLKVREGPPEPPLLGRNKERTLLRKELRTPPGKELRGILISGEAGIGKTRLIKEALHGPPVDGQRVFSAESAELEQLIPLNPWIDALRGQDVGEVLRELDEPWRTVLFGVMPGHYPGEGPIPEAPQIQPGSVPRRLFEAFYQLLLSLVRDGPVILVLEDIHWADDTTLSVLDFLVRRWDQGGLQLLVSVRSEEMRKNKALGQFLENLRIHKDFQDVPLS
ncbi:MAG: AAA family ATPase, partial [Gemmatimonadetes bacterium]|nr:AAA family ATPase [Gemmatimonadota bacterium]